MTHSDLDIAAHETVVVVASNIIPHMGLHHNYDCSMERRGNDQQRIRRRRVWGERVLTRENIGTDWEPPALEAVPVVETWDILPPPATLSIEVNPLYPQPRSHP